MITILADTFGNVFLVVAVLAIVGSVVGFFVLADKTSKGVVLLLAIALFVIAPMIPAEGDRLMTGIQGIVRFTGFIGILIGIYDLIRKRPVKQ